MALKPIPQKRTEGLRPRKVPFISSFNLLFIDEFFHVLRKQVVENS